MSEDQDEPLPPERDIYAGFNRSAGGFELVVSPLLLALLGLWLDSRLGTTPILCVLLAVLGVAGVIVKLLFQYRATMADHEREAPWSRS